MKAPNLRSLSYLCSQPRSLNNVSETFTDGRVQFEQSECSGALWKTTGRRLVRKFQCYSRRSKSFVSLDIFWQFCCCFYINSLFREDTKENLANKLFEHSVSRDHLLLTPSVHAFIFFSICWWVELTNPLLFLALHWSSKRPWTACKRAAGNLDRPRKGKYFIAISNA